MIRKQIDVDNTETDYGYIAYLRKAMDNTGWDHRERDLTGRDLSLKEKRIPEIMLYR